MSGAVYTVDLARCTGCQACLIACRDRADRPEGVDWLRVERHEAGTFPAPVLTYRVVHCFHCAEPPCVDACPELGISRTSQGLVSIDAQRCVACGRCFEACPFGAIAELPDGSASKCDGCADEVWLGWGPTCVRACPMRALAYGPPAAAGPRRVPDDRFQHHGVGPAVAYWRRPPGGG